MAALLLTNRLTRISSVSHHVEVRRRHDAGGLLAFRISADLSYPQCPSASTCSSGEHSPFMHKVYPLSSLSKSTRIDIYKFSFLVLPKVPPRLQCNELRIFLQEDIRAIYVDMWIFRAVNPRSLHCEIYLHFENAEALRVRYQIWCQRLKFPGCCLRSAFREVTRLSSRPSLQELLKGT